MSQELTTVRNVFEDAQDGFRHHAKLVKAMKKIQNKYSSEEEFREAFVDHLKHALVEFRREPAFERIIEFAAKFSTAKDYVAPKKKVGEFGSDSEDDDNSSEFLKFMFKFLLDSHESRSKAIRFRVCQMVNKLLTNMDDNASIDDELADAIFDAMFVRLQDKIPAVRAQAVAALCRLQDPSDSECPIITAYLQLMSCDSSPDVRRAVLLRIAVTPKTLPSIIERTCDTTVPVRKLAFCVLAEKVHIKSFTIAQRIRLLEGGLTDQSATVREMCVDALLKAWLKTFEGNTVNLLKALDVENAEEPAKMVLKAVFKGLTVEALREHVKTLRGDSENEGVLGISPDKLDSETAFYWCNLGQHLKSLGVEGEELLDELLPEVSGFCDYIQRYTEEHLRGEPDADCEQEFQQIFILRQLLMLVGEMDLCDEVGRKRLLQLVHDMLVSPEVSGSLVATLHSCYVSVQPDEEARIQEMVEIIADVRQPIVMVETALTKEEKRQWELKLAGVKVKLNQLRDEMEECVSKQEFSRAAELKQMISELEEERDSLTQDEGLNLQVVREEKDDPDTLLKCLTIASEMLQRITRNEFNPTLTTLMETLIIPGVQNEDPSVRNVAIKCLGLCDLLSCALARTHLVLFLQVAQLDHEAVQITALQVVFDLLLMFGLEAFKVTSPPEAVHQDSTEDMDNEEKNDEENEHENEKEGQSEQEDIANSVLRILTELLESESNSVRDVTAEGFAKLLLAGRVLSAKLLSRLILLWHNPTTEDDAYLRHCIGVFLPAFAFASRDNQELVEEAFLPTLGTLFNAPLSSPLASVNAVNVAELLLAMANSRNLNKNSGNSLSETSSHVALAMKVANEILSDPEAVGVRVMCKVLTMMDLSGSDQSVVKDMKVLCNQMIQEVEDNTSVKSLQKFQKTLAILDTSDDQGCNESSQSATEQTSQEQTSTGSDITNGQDEKTQDNSGIQDDTAEKQPVEGKERLNEDEPTQPGSMTREDEESATLCKTPSNDRVPSTIPKSRTRNTKGKKSKKSKSVATVEKSTRVTRSAVRKSKAVEPLKTKLDMAVFDSSSDKDTEDDDDDVFDS